MVMPYNWNGTEEQRFWRRVVIAENGCWEWRGYIKPNGYATFSLVNTPTRKGKKIYAHVWVYEKYVAIVPDDWEVDHLCRNRKCVNPRHLEGVTHLVNVLRGEAGSAKAAKQTACIYGHPLTPDNVYLYFYRNRPVRQCRICRSRRMREFYQRKRNTL